MFTWQYNIYINGEKRRFTIDKNYFLTYEPIMPRLAQQGLKCLKPVT